MENKTNNSQRITVSVKNKKEYSDERNSKILKLKIVPKSIQPINNEPENTDTKESLINDFSIEESSYYDNSVLFQDSDFLPDYSDVKDSDDELIEEVFYEDQLPETKSLNISDNKKEIDSKKDKQNNNDSSSVLDFFDIFQCVFVALVCGILIFLIFGRVVRVDGRSMYPTLHNDDKIVASNLFYTPKYGDIVILKSEAYNKPLVKRVIATEGQTIDIDFENGIVYVDGKPLDEPYIYEKTYLSEGFEGPVEVPDGHIFVMGDNRNDSSDSRKHSIGFIDNREVIGKAYFLLLPAVEPSKTRDWTRVGSVY